MNTSLVSSHVHISLLHRSSRKCVSMDEQRQLPEQIYTNQQQQQQKCLCEKYIMWKLLKITGSRLNWLYLAANMKIESQ